MGHEKRLLDFEIIQQATLGDENALQKVVAHYNGYIRILSTRTYIGDDGRKHCVVDEEIRGRLQGKLMKAVMQFNINRK
ncbi:MAG: helix-turn-helix domain-containing protein [Lachnospiraceae bacterium]|nr:helix-turn-helix domain-containing protein [Lachnospiraceae bacterium]